MGGRRVIGAIAAGVLTLGLGAAFADNAPAPDLFAKFRNSDAVVLAIRSEFAPVGGHVRLTVFDDPETFLEAATARHEATLDGEGIAVITLKDLAPGDYAFVAYLDENGDGKLNRNAFGKPKEPFIFSNDIKPKLRKPTFDETKVAIAPGEVVVLTLED